MMFNVSSLDELRGLENQPLRSTCRCAVRFWRRAGSKRRCWLVVNRVDTPSAASSTPIRKVSDIRGWTLPATGDMAA